MKCTLKELEQQIFDLERVRIVFRGGTILICDAYDYKKSIKGDKPLDVLIKRINKRLGKNLVKYLIITRTGLICDPYMHIKMDAIRFERIPLNDGIMPPFRKLVFNELADKRDKMIEDELQSIGSSLGIGVCNNSQSSEPTNKKDKKKKKKGREKNGK